MPVIHVTAPASEEPGRDTERLAALCRAAAGPLGLPADAVIAVLAPAAATADGLAGAALPAWPLAVFYGRARPAAAMRAALDAAAVALAEGWGVPVERTWVQWCPAEAGQIADPAAARGR